MKPNPNRPWIAKLRKVRLSLGLPPLLPSKKSPTSVAANHAAQAKPQIPKADWSVSSPRIDVLKRGIVGWQDVGRQVFAPASWGNKQTPFPDDKWHEWQAKLTAAGYDIGQAKLVHAQDREGGKDWPLYASTMVGWKRLTQWEQAILHCLDAEVPGDFVETGVWRGGVLILAAAILEEHQETKRLIWGFDSFDGLPPPDPSNYPGDATVTDLSRFKELKVSRKEVLSNFEAWGVPVNQVRLVKGLFKDTLHKAEVEQIAVLRLDGDYYESTIQSLEALEPRVAENGVIIIDDFHDFPECRKAVEDYRARNGITFPMHEIDGMGVFWYKSMTPENECKRFRQLARQEIFSQQSKWMADLAERRARVNAHIFDQESGPQRYDWMNAVIEKRGAKAYLEIGVRNPEDCFDRIQAPEKTSVDPGVEFEANPVDFPMTSDAFFAHLDSGELEGFASDHEWDVIFIDGLHRAAQVDRDIRNAKKHLRQGGMIVLHDCLPMNEHFAHDAYPGKDNLEHKGAWNGSTWRAFYKHWLEGQTRAYVIAHDWGIGVIDSSKSRQPISLEGEWGLASLADYKEALEKAGCILTFEAALAQL